MGLNTFNIRHSVMNCGGWAMIGFYMIYLKYIDIYKRYFSITQEANYGGTPINYWQNIIDILNFFSADIFLLLVGSFTIVLASFVVKRKILLPIQSLITVLLIVLLYANQHSWGTVGQYLNFPSALIATSFAFEAPDTAMSYFDNDSLLVITLIILFALAVTIWSKSISNIKIIRKIIVPIYVFVVLFLGAGLIAGANSKSIQYPVMAGFLSSSFQEILPKFSEDEAMAGHVMDGMTPNINFGVVTKNQKASNNLLINSPQNNDIIIFILETVPARFMSLQDRLEDYPTLSYLSDHSLIALQHYTTFPASSEAFSSIIYGNYAPRSYYQTCLLADEIKPGKKIPGLVSDIAAAGTKAALYMPYAAKAPLDKVLHKNSGFSKVYYANEFEAREGYSRDEQALSEMLSDIESWTDQNQRYATFFLPQIGHAPWSGRDKDTSVVEYGRQLTIRQDKWLAATVELLKKQGRLDKTTIIVTGDHGIRTKTEDESFIPGKIDEYTYHVPLFIYSQQFDGKNYINAPTSHVDIAPTLTAMLGLLGKENNYTGIPLWFAQSTKRDIFLPAGWYYSSDGFLSENKFYMWSPPIDTVFQNDQLKFSMINAVQDAKIKQEAITKINSFYSLQEDRVRDICRTFL